MDTFPLERLIAEHWKFYTVDDVGLLCFDPFAPGKAHVHITFWDKRLRGREGLCRTALLEVMNRSNVDTVLTAIPLGLRVVRAFAKRVGMHSWKVLNGREVLIGTPSCFTMKHPEVVQ